MEELTDSPERRTLPPPARAWQSEGCEALLEAFDALPLNRQKTLVDQGAAPRSSPPPGLAPPRGAPPPPQAVAKADRPRTFHQLPVQDGFAGRRLLLPPRAASSSRIGRVFRHTVLPSVTRLLGSGLCRSVFRCGHSLRGRNVTMDCPARKHAALSERDALGPAALPPRSHARPAFPSASLVSDTAERTGAGRVAPPWKNAEHPTALHCWEPVPTGCPSGASECADLGPSYTPHLRMARFSSI